MILEALFNGEIYASENVVPKSDKFREATGEIARIMSFFEDKLRRTTPCLKSSATVTQTRAT